MIVTVITICYNEIKFVPFFLSYWSHIADVIVCYDGKSTDGTREELARWPRVEIVDGFQGGLFDDAINMQIKSTAYKSRQSDWFIVCDFDELIFHPDGVRTALERHEVLGATVALPCEAWHMIADDYPDPARPITEQVRQGVRDRNYDKTLAFKSCAQIRYGAGAHDCQFDGCVVRPPNVPRFHLLHYKFLGEAYVREKIERCVLSENNRRMKWGYFEQRIESRLTWMDSYHEGMAKRVQVI